MPLQIEQYKNNIFFKASILNFVFCKMSVTSQDYIWLRCRIKKAGLSLQREELIFCTWRKTSLMLMPAMLQWLIQ